MSENGQKVYVLERGVYHERYVAGVYASPEAAMRDNPAEGPERNRREGEWHQTSDRAPREWDNGFDFDSSAVISEHEVLDA